MKMLKIQLSAIISPAMPTGPRDREDPWFSSGVAMAVAVFTFDRSQLFVFPVRVVGMFEVPKRTTALHHGDLRKVVLRRWRRRGPFQRPRVPWIISRGSAFTQRTDDIENENQQTRGL